MALAYSYARCSTKIQDRGATFKRQAGLREAWLAKNPQVHLADTPMEDAGFSAFKGDHAKFGKLKTFLELCQAGRIPKGSYFLVENLDRLSREECGEALKLFLQILDHCTIVTFEPETIFRKPVDMSLLMIAIVELSRGHSESKAKSFRSVDTWDRRRLNLGKQILSARCPSWIDVEGSKPRRGEADQRRFVINKAKAAIVKRICGMACKGYGSWKIASTFNGEKVPTISKAKLWHDGYIYDILHNTALFGQFQPMRKDDTGKEVPYGPPIANYYPAILSKSEWDSLQSYIRLRKKSEGKITQDVSNLFTNLVFNNFGQKLSMRGMRYLTPADHVLRQTATCVPIKEFEKAILYWIGEINLTLEGNDFGAINAKKIDLENRIKTIKHRIKLDANLDCLLDTLSELEAECKDTLAQLERAAKPQDRSLIRTRKLIELVKRDSGYRRELKQQIKTVISKILVQTEARRKVKLKRFQVDVFFVDGSYRRLYFDKGTSGLVAVDGKLNEQEKGIIRDRFMEYMESGCQ